MIHVEDAHVENPPGAEVGRLVQVGDGRQALFDRTIVWLPLADDDVEPGRPRVVGLVRMQLNVVPESDDDDAKNEVQAELLTVRIKGGLRTWEQLPPLRDLRAAAIAKAVWAPPGTDVALAVEAVQRVGRRRHRMTDDRLREVAEVYRRAEAAGVPPRMAVADHLEVAPDTASKWLKAAEQAGHPNRRKVGSGGEV